MSERIGRDAALSWDELDELADWAAGLLAGPAADRVARLVAADPRWASAHAALVAAEPAVRDALHRALEGAPAMPAELVERLTTGLAASRRADSGPRRTAPATRSDPSGPPSSRPPSRAARRRPLLTTLAALLVLASLGGIAVLGSMVTGDRATNERSDMAGQAPDNVGSTSRPGPPIGSGAGVPSWQPEEYAGIDVNISDADYQRDDLAALYRSWPGVRASAVKPAIRDSNFLDLGSQDGFASCLDAVARTHPGRVEHALFASFEGQPALFLVVAGPPPMVVVVGARCGQGIVDELASVEVN